jgi:hypothetical protein
MRYNFYIGIRSWLDYLNRVLSNSVEANCKVLRMTHESQQSQIVEVGYTL